MTYSKQYLTKLIKEKSIELGFSAIGISRARHLSELEGLLHAWLKKGMHGEMHYMQNHFEKRLDPRLLVEGANSVITVMLNYFPEKELSGKLRISKYAYGSDYHHIIRDKLYKLRSLIEEKTGDLNARAFTDSAPMMDKAWAREAGLGWIGKNTCLINKDSGSFFFIGHLVTSLDLEYDNPFEMDHCGTCNSA